MRPALGTRENVGQALPKWKKSALGWLLSMGSVQLQRRRRGGTLGALISSVLAGLGFGLCEKITKPCPIGAREVSKNSPRRAQQDGTQLEAVGTSGQETGFKGN